MIIFPLIFSSVIYKVIFTRSPHASLILQFKAKNFTKISILIFWAASDMLIGLSSHVFMASKCVDAIQKRIIMCNVCGI